MCHVPVGSRGDLSRGLVLQGQGLKDLQGGLPQTQGNLASLSPSSFIHSVHTDQGNSQMLDLSLAVRTQQRWRQLPRVSALWDTGVERHQKTVVESLGGGGGGTYNHKLLLSPMKGKNRSGSMREKNRSSCFRLKRVRTF